MHRAYSNMTIDNIIKQVEDIQNNLESQAKILLDDNKINILDLVRSNQLFDLGEDGNKNKLRPYTPFTKLIKRKQGRRDDVVTLFDEGNFYKGFDQSLKGDELTIFSRDSKSEKLTLKYGKDIFKLNKENEELTNTDLQVKLIKWVLSSIKI